LDTENSEPFEKFMARALHDPRHGYYARNIRDIGGRGDFTTAPQLSEAPGKAIAAWLCGELRQTGVRNVIEIGPGLGTLSQQVIRNLPFLLRLRTQFHLVESSPRLSERQKSQLGAKVRHHTSIHSALKACSGEAIVFSNELVDAFAVRVFEKAGGQWCELALDHSAGRTVETLLPPANLPPSSAFSRNFPEGQRVEIHDSYRMWLESWLPDWTRGAMLTIDYGDRVERLYHRRPKGTLRAYFLHQKSEGPEIYLNPGLRDITADVNFTDLAEWSQPWLESADPLSLEAFIRRFAADADQAILAASSHFTVLSQRRRDSER
jgi:SAM-dependent MidA family methyltransferase